MSLPLRKVFASTAFVAAVTVSGAQAAIVKQSYTDWARALFVQLDAVVAARGLNAEEAGETRRSAAIWVYLGPCRGDARKAEKDGYGMPNLFHVKPSRSSGAALLEMIAILVMNSNLGREPWPDYLCKFAAETAVPQTPIK